MQEILKKVQVNIPFHLLVNRFLPLVLKERINPEIGLDCFALDHFGREDFIRVAHTLHDSGVTITLHAPFFDLRPGALDSKIRKSSIDRLKQCFDLVPYFKPKSLVCHTGFDERYYRSNEERWLENSRETWSYFLTIATEMNTTIALENVYENDPLYFGRLLESFRENSQICCCFDTGHCNAFSQKPLEVWIEKIGIYIGELHLHDNHGLVDEHAPVGTGNFPFHDLFSILKEKNFHPIITLEPHSEKDLWTSLAHITSMHLLD